MTLASVVGFLIVNLLGMVLFLMFVVALAMAGSAEGQGVVSDNSLLHIKLEGELTDRTKEDPLGYILGTGNSTQGVDDIIAALDEAKTNDKVKAVFLEVGQFSANMANLEELHRALMLWRSAGKRIYAYGDNYTQAGYYLATTANEILLGKDGMIDLRGVAITPIYYKDLLEKIGVSMQLIRVGKYKSAGEVYIQNTMSEANREQLSQLATSLWGVIQIEICSTRDISKEVLDDYINNYLTLAKDSDYRAYNLVDKVCYADEARAFIGKAIGLEQGDALSLVTPQMLLKHKQTLSTGKDQVAVYYAVGTIVDDIIPNAGGEDQISATEVVPDLETLAKDDAVKAVVLRINSPGGSASASEKIWRAVKRLQATKPVVVSMGGMAASGGYYIAMGGQRIFADASTITGSIGIYAMVPEASGLLTQKLGLRFESVKTHTSSDFMNTIARPLTTAETTALQAYVDRGYDLFLRRVDEGRALSLEQVQAYAQGRVWSGVEAQRRGLVDEVGSLKDAIYYAADLAKLEEGGYETIALPILKPWYETIGETAKQSYFERELREVMGELYTPLMYSRTLRGQNALQMALPYHLDIR